MTRLLIQLACKVNMNFDNPIGVQEKKKPGLRTQ
jgi:hypothetical protein